MNVKTYSNAQKIQKICIYYLLAWLISPPLGFGNIFRALAVVCAIIWLILERIFIPQNSKTPRQIKLFFSCIIFYGSVLYIVQFFFNGQSFVGAFVKNINTYILFFFGYIAAQYIKNKRIDELIKFINFIIVLGLIFSLTTILRSSDFRTMTRAAGGEDSAEFNLLAQRAARHGVGGFGFVCFTSVFAPILLYTFLSINDRYKYCYYKYLIPFIILEAEVLSAGYTLALAISIIGIISVLITKIKNITLKVLIVIIGAFFIMFWRDISTDLYYILRDITEDTMYANKVEDIFEFLNNGSSEETFYERQSRYETSLLSIFRYPVLGSYFIAGTQEIGHHSSLLDAIASYGIIPGIAWIYLIIVYPTKSIDESLKDKKLVMIEIIVLTLTALFNRYTMHMGVFYLILPVVPCLIFKSNDLIIKD